MYWKLIVIFYNFTLDIIRTLGIIRLKNPSRGIKRTRQGNESQDNPLSGIVEWLQVVIFVQAYFCLDYLNSIFF